MSETIKNRICALRKYLVAHNLHAFIVPSSDSHLSEYPADRWKSREWISGFTGSAGTIVVTLHQAGLWTDSRYFLQADDELEGTGIELFKERIPETPTIAQWLSESLKPGETVGVDGKVFSAKEANALLQTFAQKGLQLNTKFDPLEEIWENRPQIPQASVYELPIEFAGISPAEKIQNINAELAKLGANGLLVSSLDSIAWIFNLRGSDVEYNPVFVSYAYVSPKETVLFIDPKKVNPDVASHLQKEGVVLAHYSKFFDYVGALKGQTICIQSDKTSYCLWKQAAANNQIIDAVSPADLLKAQKNKVEIEGFRRALIKDGVALVRFFRWLEEAVPTGIVTEHLISEKLVEYRSQQEGFVGESFGTIAGFQGNGAIVHYHADKNTAKQVWNEGLLLIDSGGQYFDGTTDITRTVALGELSAEIKRDYTNVLKGHIALASAVFPEGTRGSQLDAFTRQFLWKSGANYLHGTGHGIGHFLNVHEGPQSIRMEENPVTLREGMVMSNEPGIYRTGKYGVRTENLVVVKECCETEFGKFYQFETLTLCPIDTSPIDIEMLSKEEIDWLNEYHQRVFNSLSPYLNEEEKAWLKEKTKGLPV
ncbi:MAG: ampp [Bacteroidetes bacterium]|nr:ampp [Bacteroidota bacterium]